jgi:hypothetical protein
MFGSVIPADGVNANASVAQFLELLCNKSKFDGRR